jgi:uncharacterized protein YegP (UPF0339 family)
MADATFQVTETADGTFRWHLRTDDGTVIATSDGTHATRHAAVRDVQRVKHAAPEAGVESSAAGDADADADHAR